MVLAQVNNMYDQADYLYENCYYHTRNKSRQMSVYLQHVVLMVWFVR